MHINARSLSRNLDALVSELSLLSNMPSVIAVTDTWAITVNDSFPIPGYTSIIKARKNRPGGVVGLYIQDALNFSYKLRPDLSTDTTSESLFIQLTNNKYKNVIIGVIYKPPDSDVTKFTKSIEQLLNIVTKEHRPCYLMGDFNIDLLKNNKHFPTQYFVDVLISSGFYPLIIRPTRITENFATLIDNIFTNVHDVHIKPGIWIVDISDHLPVLAILSSKFKNCKTKKVVAKQDFRQTNVDKF